MKRKKSDPWEPGPLTELRILKAAAVLAGMPDAKYVTLYVDRACFRRWKREITRAERAFRPSRERE